MRSSVPAGSHKLRTGRKFGWFAALLLAFCLLIVGVTYRQYRQQRLDHDLIAAVQRDDAKAVMTILHSGARAEARESAQPANFWTALRHVFGWRRSERKPGNTALNIAIGRLTVTEGDFAKRQEAIDRIVPALLNAGADPNRADSNGDYPLFSAVMWASPATVQNLLDHRANVNAVGFVNATPLMMAAGNDHNDATQRLLEHGADVNARTDNGMTALMYAAGGGAVHNTQLLLKYHADTHFKDQQGLTALQWAQRNNRQEVVKLLQAGETAKHAN